MPFRPGDSYSKEFVTNAANGAAADADSLPAATADLDGSGTGSMSLTVTHLDTGRYKITGTVPAGRVRGDVLNVLVAATVSSVAAKAIVDTQVIEVPLYLGTITVTGTPTTTSIQGTSTNLKAASNEYINRKLYFDTSTTAEYLLTGPCTGHTYSSGTHTFTFATANNDVPAAGDVGKLMGN